MRKMGMIKRLLLLAAAGGSLGQFNSCGLSDQQLSAIVQSVLTTGLSALVSNLVSTTVGGTQSNGQG